MPKNVPPYSHHKSSGRAYVYINCKRIYLGKHGTPESHKRYSEEISKWQGQQTEAVETTTVKQLTLFFIKHCETHYRKNGELTSEYGLMKLALRHLNRKFRDEPTDALTPMKLAVIRQGMINSGDYCRKTINGYIKRIVQCFKWGVSKGLVKVTVYQALTTLDGLQHGRCDVRESEPVKPVPLSSVEAVKPHISPPLWGAIQFQLATAARPSEALQLRLGEIERSGEVWIYRPGAHKTQHHGKSKTILIGPKGQAVIQTHLESSALDTFVFALPGTGGMRCYRRDSYTNAIKRACERAFDMPEELRNLKADAPEDLRDKAATWRAEHCWHPHQLRHTAGTLFRRVADAETAQIILGHAKIETTEIYAERDLLKAAEIIRKIG